MVGHRLGRAVARATGALALALLLSPGSALAYSEGQTGFSGRTPGQSCLQCHGSKQYDGMKFRIETEDTAPCFQGDGAEAEVPLLEAGKTYTAYVEIAAPGGDAPLCPTHNCCNPGTGENWPPAEDEACMERGGCTAADDPNLCCKPGIDLCAGPRAGFNAEVVGGGEFAPGDGTRLKRVGDDLFGNEITHAIPKDVANGGAWTFQYTAPAPTDLARGLEFWVGANVGNGNDIEDPEDKNSNFVLHAAVQDSDGNIQMPGFCLVCPNGAPPAFGSCCCNSSAAGGDVGAAGGYGSFALLSFLGFLLLRRRGRA